MVVVSTTLLSTSCSILSNTNETAIKCSETIKEATMEALSYRNEKVKNVIVEEVYLINPKDEKVLLYTDTGNTEQDNVVFAPKIIRFTEPTYGTVSGSIYKEINRETLKIKINGAITDDTLNERKEVNGEGICKKIPHPPKVSSKSKI